MTEAGFREVQVHGRFFGPWVLVRRVSPRALDAGLRSWERFDDRLSERDSLRGRYRP